MAPQWCSWGTPTKAAHDVSGLEHTVNMRRSDTPRLRICLFPDPTKAGGIHGVRLKRRGRSKYCPKHSNDDRQQRLRVYRPRNTARWRRAHPDLERLRNFIKQYLQRNYCPDLNGWPQRPLALRAVQKAFADPVAGPDRRQFGHCLVRKEFGLY